MQQLPLGVRLAETARFEGFVAGPNREPLERMTGASPPRLLWLWGRAGTGKTHLLQSACARVGAVGGTSAYLDLRSATAPEFLEGLESLDLVCLDGLEHVAADPDWNVAVFRLHTLMQDGSGRIDVSSTPPPATLAFTLPDLRSRLLAASIHQLHELNEDELLEVLERRAMRRGLQLPRESATYLVHRLPRDTHSLCAVLDRLDEAALAAQRRLTVPFLREVLEDQSAGGS